MGVVSRWMRVESMGVASGCGCKEVYRFPHITYSYSSCICSFFAASSLLFVHFFSSKIIFNKSVLSEQVAYKRGVARPKKMATGINYCQNGCLAKAKVTLVFWTQALSHSLQGFSLKKGH